MKTYSGSAQVSWFECICMECVNVGRLPHIRDTKARARVIFIQSQCEVQILSSAFPHIQFTNWNECLR